MEEIKEAVAEMDINRRKKAKEQKVEIKHERKLKYKRFSNFRFNLTFASLRVFFPVAFLFTLTIQPGYLTPGK